MRAYLHAVVCCGVLTATGAFGQGQINFNNRVTATTAVARVNSPIFGPETNDPTIVKIGGTATGNPAGSTVYSGARLLGTGYTAQLWFAPGEAAAEEALQPVSTVTFRESTVLGGYVQPPSQAVSLPGVTTGRVTLQVRAWDNKGGSITNWDQVEARPQTVLRGKSNLFSPPYDLGTDTNPPPALEGLMSFNLYLPSPSPPVILAQPRSQIVAAGSSFALHIDSAGFPVPDYYWYHNETNLVATSKNLVVHYARVSQTGTYTVVISNEVGTATSEPALVTVYPTAHVTMVPMLSVNGDTGGIYRIEYVPLFGDQATWLLLTNITLTSQPHLYLDFSGTNQPKRFYRIVSGPRKSI